MSVRIAVVAAVLALLQIVGATTLSCRRHWERARHQVVPDDWSRCLPAPCVIIDCAHPDVTCPRVIDTPEGSP